jgi:hypothetical protein
MAGIGERIIGALGGMTQEEFTGQISQVKAGFAKETGELKADFEQKLQRTYEAGVSDGLSYADDGNDEKKQLTTADGKVIGTGYKPISSTPRDLSGWSQEKAIDAAYRLWNTNPLAGALIEIVVDYVVGEGIKVTAEDEAVQKVLDKFLSDPVNDLIGEDGSVGSGLEGMVRELSIFGEQLILTFVRDGSDIGVVGDGRVRIGTVDPKQIHSVITDTNNAKDILAVRLKGSGAGDGPLYKVIRSSGAGEILEGKRNFKKYKETINKAHNKKGTERNLEAIKQAMPDLEPPIAGKEYIVSDAEDLRTLRMEAAKSEEKRSMQPTGECFLFQVNKISTGVRGRPDILRMIDWMDRFDQLFFDGAEHVAILNAFAWDLEIKGGTADNQNKELNLTTQARIVSKLRSGSVYSHNENATLEPKNPDLKTQDVETIIRDLRVLISGGARIPEHWLGEGSRANRATAEVMGEPTFRMLTRRQAFVRNMLRKMCQYQIDVAVALGVLPEVVKIKDENGNDTKQIKPTRQAFSVDMPDINVEDTSIATRSFATVAQAVAPLVAMNLLTRYDAMVLIAAVAKLVGVNINVEKALEELQNDISGATGQTLQDIKDLIDSLKDDSSEEEPGSEEEV